LPDEYCKLDGIIGNMTQKPLYDKRILFAVINWGLGHAVEAVPMIRLLQEHNEVILAATGRTAAFLTSEFPDLPFYDVPDHAINYARRRRLLVPKLIGQIPKLLFGLWREHRQVEQLVETLNIDIVISENRYGAYSRNVPSYFLTHQLRYKLPGILTLFEFISVWFNRWYFRKYTKILVPDEKGIENISGDLTHFGRISQHPKLHYIGVWTSIEKKRVAEDIDILAIISGPEPQRQIFADKIIEQLKTVPGKRIVLLGIPEAERKEYIEDGIKIYTFKSRSEVGELLNRAKLVICRSGYGSPAELVALRKPTVMVPTPGQSEQEYLACHFMERHYFYSVSQDEMNLSGDIPIARKFCMVKKGCFSINQAQLFWDAIGEDGDN
jgi:UDP-N-acetylglucosamine:LPS N-acetylglucosamine transferase